MEIAAVVLLIIILLVLVMLFLRKPAAPQASNTQELLLLKDSEHEKAISYLKEEKARLEQDLIEARNTLAQESARMIKAEEAFKAQRDKLDEQKGYIDELQQKFKLEFENIANKVLEEKSSKFVEQNRTNLDMILNPLKENIKAFEEKVEKVYKAESDERNTLKGVIAQLMDQSKQIQEDANNRTRALKGDSKKQGNWGEVILERVMERSGLVKDREYRIQASMTSPDGSRLQPDIVIDLPDQKHVVVDSKVSLVAYERYVTAETEEDKELHIKQHLASIKAHIQDLSSKN